MIGLNRAVARTALIGIVIVSALAGCASPGGGAASKGMRVESAAGLKFSVPQEWSAEEPTSNMRAAQFVLPAAGEGEDAPELVVFHFGAGQGGGTQANIDRWIGQMTQPDGKSSSERAKRAKRTVGTCQVSTVIVDGTYSAGGMMGMMGSPHGGGPQGGDPHSGGQQKENYRLWAAVVEGEGGPWFFKCSGPKAAMEKAEAGLEAMLSSVKAAPVPAGE